MDSYKTKRETNYLYLGWKDEASQKAKNTASNVFCLIPHLSIQDIDSFLSIGLNTLTLP